MNRRQRRQLGADLSNRPSAEEIRLAAFVVTLAKQMTKMMETRRADDVCRQISGLVKAL